MDMKNAAILLIFALAILGLMVGVYYTDDVDSENSHDSDLMRIYEDNGGVLNVKLVKEKIDNFYEIVT